MSGPQGNPSEEREIMSFGGNVMEVGFNEESHENEAFIKLPDFTIRISGISAEMAKEFALHLYQQCSFSVKVRP